MINQPPSDGDGVTGIPMIQWINDWGVICDDGWDDADATVICNSYPGYGSGGIPIFGLSEDVKTAEDVWLTGEPQRN